MARLVLEDLKVEGFRNFESLSVKRLGRVNLIVGKNNVGKTALLEGLRIYAHRGAIPIIMETLQSRDEDNRVYERGDVDIEQQADMIGFLFNGYGKGITRNGHRMISIGPKGDGRKTLRISLEWIEPSERGARSRTQTLFEARQEVFGRGERAQSDEDVPAIAIRYETDEELYRIDRDLRDYVRRSHISRSRDINELRSVFVSSEGLSRRQIGRFWDNISLTGHEDEVLSSLSIVDGRVDRVNLVGEQGPRRERVPIVKMHNLDTPIPIRSMGEGMSKMLDISLSLVNSAQGMLLVDEIDNGLHYSVQSELWRLVFETAARLEVQVFATTHSMDCIRAFQHAAREHSEEGMLVSLRRKRNTEDEIVAVLSDEEALETIVDTDIEVR